MEKKRSILSKIANSCFYLGVIIEVLIVLIDKSAYMNPIEGRLFQITFVLFFLKVCLTKYSWKEYLTIALFLGVGAASYFITDRNDLVRIVIFIAACKEIDMIKCLKLVFWMTVIGCMTLILLSICGILGDVALVRDYGRGSMETRYVLGLGHPNALQCMVCVLTILGIYIYHSKLRWYHYAEILAINLFFFLLTDSKTALLIAGGSILCFFIAPKQHSKVLGRLFAAGNAGLFLGSIAISVLAAKDAMSLWYYFTEGVNTPKARFYAMVDKLLTGRIASLIETKNHEGVMETWRLFSGPANNYYFDMGWVRLFYWYGIIPATLMITVLVIFVIYFMKKQKYEELILFSMLALYTVVEAHMVSVYIARNYVLFIIGMYWYRLKRE